MNPKLLYSERGFPQFLSVCVFVYVFNCMWMLAFSFSHSKSLCYYCFLWIFYAFFLSILTIWIILWSKHIFRWRNQNNKHRQIGNGGYFCCNYCCILWKLCVCLCLFLCLFVFMLIFSSFITYGSIENF